MQKLKLYHYWRSSSSWRVRWAFALKNIDCEFVHLDLLTGETESSEHLKRNPLGFVPTLEIHHSQSGKSKYLAESMAMIEWAEELWPTPSLLPGDAFDRAWIRQLAEVINADTQPLQNLNPQFLHSDDPERRKAWAVHWIKNGLGAYETLVQKTAGKFSFQNELSLADLYLVPQCYNALRYDVALSDFPTVSRVYEQAIQTPSYEASHPDCFKP